MSLPMISDLQIRRGANHASFVRGEQLFATGAVGELVLRGDLLRVMVAGSQGGSYQVTIGLAAQGLRGAACTCPYDGGGWCKHIVAALLTYARAAPDAVTVRPTLPEVIAAADRDQLAAALLRLAQRDPDLVETIDALLRAPLPEPTDAVPDDPGDPEAVRRRVQHALARAHPDDDDAAAAIVEEIQPLVDDLNGLIAAGAADRALPLLAALTEALIPQWHTYADPEAELAFFVDDLGLLWADALLTAELTPEARAGWRQRLAAWRRAPGSQRVDGLVRGEQAAAEGWDAPWLAAALRGETPAGTLTLTPESAELISLRLAVLERRGRAEAALNLAVAAGDVAAQIRLLIRLGRGAEAVQVGLTQLCTTEEGSNGR